MQFFPGKTPFKQSTGNPAQARAQTTLNKLSGSPVGNTAAGHALQAYIRSQIAKGEGLDAFYDDIEAKAKSEVAKHKQTVLALQNMLRTYFVGGNKLRRLQLEVMLPAKGGQLSTPLAWQRIDDIAHGRPASRATPTTTSSSSSSEGDSPNKSMTPVLTAFEQRFGNVYFAVNAKVEAAVVLGGGASIGVGGMRHRQAFVTTSYTIGLGLSAEVEAAVELSVSMQPPKTETKVTVEVAAGAAYGVSGEVSVSLQPIFAPGRGPKPAPPWPLRPDMQTRMVQPEKTPMKDLVNRVKESQYDGLIFDYAFDGISVNIGVGMGADFSTSLVLGDSILLMP